MDITVPVWPLTAQALAPPPSGVGRAHERRPPRNSKLCVGSTTVLVRNCKHQTGVDETDENDLITGTLDRASTRV